MQDVTTNVAATRTATLFMGASVARRAPDVQSFTTGSTRIEPAPADAGIRFGPPRAGAHADTPAARRDVPVRPRCASLLQVTPTTHASPRGSPREPWASRRPGHRPNPKPRSQTDPRVQCPCSRWPMRADGQRSAATKPEWPRSARDGAAHAEANRCPPRRSRCRSGTLSIAHRAGQSVPSGPRARQPRPQPLPRRRRPPPR